MGLFDALPPVSSKKSTRDDEDEGAGEDGAKNQSCDDRKKKKQKINERDDVIETRREPSPTTQKEGTITVDDGRLARKTRQTREQEV